VDTATGDLVPVAGAGGEDGVIDKACGNRRAVRDRVVSSSPCDGVRLPEIRHRKVEPPPLELVGKLAAALPAEFSAVVALVAGSGLRQGEVFGFEVERLDFLRGRSVEVMQQLVTLPRQAPYLAGPKTAESVRTVPLAAVTLDQLAAHPATFPAVTVEVKDRTDPRRPVTRPARFVFTPNGRPVARHDWPAVWLPAARAVGLPPRTGLHVLRHLYASLLIRHGESIKTVQARMGHSSAAITLDTYGHLWPDADDRTREAVQRALGTAADSVRTGTSS
jgi:integrase